MQGRKFSFLKKGAKIGEMLLIDRKLPMLNRCGFIYLERKK